MDICRAVKSLSTVNGTGVFELCLTIIVGPSRRSKVYQHQQRNRVRKLSWFVWRLASLSHHWQIDKVRILEAPHSRRLENSTSNLVMTNRAAFRVDVSLDDSDCYTVAENRDPRHMGRPCMGGCVDGTGVATTAILLRQSRSNIIFRVP